MSINQPFSIYVPGKAVPQGSKTAMISASTKRPILIDSNPGLARWRNTVTDLARSRVATSKMFSFPFTGPLAVTITVVMNRPLFHHGTGKNRDKIRPSAPTHPATAPDIDKLMRAILDALTAAQVWKDDGQVVWVQAAKRYRDSTPLDGPGVHISIAPL